MTLNTASRDNRVRLGEIAEKKMIGLLMWYGKNVKRVGQETWMPSWVHGKLRYQNDIDGVVMMRHFPDLDTGRALIQVKCAPEEKRWEHVTIEKQSYETSKALHDLDIPVLVMWEFQDGKFYGNWVEELMTEEPFTPREELNGSRTPMLKVVKHFLCPVVDFLNDI
jgi:hypothetical protein